MPLGLEVPKKSQSYDYKMFEICGPLSFCTFVAKLHFSE